jgi:hypothetical protein
MKSRGAKRPLEPRHARACLACTQIWATLFKYDAVGTRALFEGIIRSGRIVFGTGRRSEKRKGGCLGGSGQVQGKRIHCQHHVDRCHEVLQGRKRKFGDGRSNSKVFGPLPFLLISLGNQNPVIRKGPQFGAQDIVGKPLVLPIGAGTQEKRRMIGNKRPYELLFLRRRVQ